MVKKEMQKNNKKKREKEKKRYRRLQRIAGLFLFVAWSCTSTPHMPSWRGA
jgi:hypothetical protein